MFSDDLKLAEERIRSLMPKLQPRWELRDIVVPLAASAIPQRVELLLETLPDSDNDTYWYEWARAVTVLTAAEQREVVRALLTDPKWTNGRSRAAFRGPGVMEVLVPVVQADDSLRRTLKSTAFFDSALPIRDFARHLLVAMGDGDSAMAALQAALTDPTLRSLAEAAIRHARWHPHPEHPRIPDRDAPQPLTALRRLLLETAHRGDDSSRDWARGLLVQIEAELEGSYPVEEPRHPHLGSGLSWPIMEKRHPSLH